MRLPHLSKYIPENGGVEYLEALCNMLRVLVMDYIVDSLVCGTKKLSLLRVAGKEGRSCCRLEGIIGGWCEEYEVSLVLCLG